MIKHVVIGIFIGLANVIPGVSGGTIAVICNVYDKLIILSSLDIKNIKAQWKPLLCLVAGLGCGITGFAKLITILYQLFPVQTNFFFLGIILGSIPFLYAKVKKAVLNKEASEKSIVYRNFILPLVLCCVGAALMLGLFFVQRHGVQTAEAETVFSAVLAVKLFGMGIVSSCAMLIPGISGSFVLLILGTYRTVIQAISDFNLLLLMPFGAGMCIGLICSARIIAFLLNRFPSTMYGFVLGLVAGSAIYLFPNVCQPFTLRLISAAALLSGYTIVSYFSRHEYLVARAHKEP